LTVIYLDTLFFLNAVVDYLLLLAAVRLAGEPLHRLRIAAGALLGGLYAVALVLPGGAFLSHPLCRGAAAVLMTAAAYGGSRRLLRQAVLFLTLTCAFGGGVVAIGLMGGHGLFLGERGVFYSALDVKTLLLSAALCYGGLTLLFQRLGGHTGPSGELLSARLTLNGRQLELTALVDTGNTLTDPMTGRPVLVAEGDCLAELFPRECRPKREDLLDPPAGMARLGTGEWKGRFRLLPYRAVGIACGLLLAVKADQVRIGAVECGPLLVALSPTPVSDGGGYRALIGPL